MGNSGGAATNSGVDFQQRVAALVLVHILTDMKDYTTLQLGHGLDVNEVRFETNDSIDDLIILSKSGRILIQAKRSPQLSDGPNSEYSDVIKQFVFQYVNSNGEKDSYVLATSAKASTRITKELRKLTEAARLNEEGGHDNPMTKSEQEVQTKTHGLLRKHYLDYTGNPLSEAALLTIFRRIHIAQLDIEEGTSLEIATIMLLSSKACVSPDLLWGALIALCVTLAKDRLSIDRNGLLQKMGPFLETQSSKTTHAARSDFFQLEYQGTFSAGREVLLVDSFVPDADYAILELYRFEDDGKKRLQFRDGTAKLLNGQTYRVIRRASTYKAIERFLEKTPDRFLNCRVAIYPINTEEDVDQAPFAKAHAALCSNMIRSRTDALMCIHCGDYISEDSVPIIEIDELLLEHQVGLTHEACLRPTDRVLGVIGSELFREHKLLRNFDYSQWFLTAPKGQAIFGATAGLTSRVCPILWVPDFNQTSKGLWCVKINLEDGSSRYVRERGKVVRYDEVTAKARALEFTGSFEQSRMKKDPWCYTSQTEGFGTYSAMLQVMSKEEECVLCIDAVAVGYTKSIGVAYSNFDNFYAPLVILLERETGLPIFIEEAIFLISDPFSLERYIKNWRRAGVELPEFSVSTIASDDEFDKFVLKIKNGGGSVVVNPMLDLQGTPSSGFVIENYYEVLEDLQSRQSGVSQ